LATPSERFISFVASKISICSAFISSPAIFSIIAGSITCWLTGTMVPRILMWIGAPAVMKMSDAWRSAIT
jgi:low affinity Fe/Cu permease